MKLNSSMHPALAELVEHPDVKASEFLTVLHSYFKYVTKPLTRTARRFGDQDQGQYLDVVFKKDGSISTITGNLGESEWKALAEHARSVLLESQKEAFAKAICFSLHDAVRGCYRYKDVFQILPIPPDAPHAPVILADHPFLLEFTYISCKDQVINGYRCMEKAARLARILNTLCNTPISRRSPYVHFFWGISQEGPCRWTQEGYGYPFFSPNPAGFSDAQGLTPINLVSANDYYGDMFFPENYALALPDSIEKYIDKVFSLSQNDARAFEIASTLFAQANELWDQARSSALVAVVSGIEALLDKEHDFCKECGQPKFGVTRKFKAFLRTHVQDIEKRFPEELKAIYEIRSGLAHGKSVLMADLRPWNYFGDPPQQWEDRFHRNTLRTTATALRNWVLSR